jgi:hypothetical protein
MRRAVILLAGGAALILAGCGKASNIVPVSGRVTMDGQPLAEARVTFQPIGDWQNPYPGPASYGVTDSNGYFTLTLMDSGQSGAMVGKHRVTITPKESAVTSSDAGYYNALPPAQQPQTVEFEVPPGGTQSANFDLKSQ